MKNSILRSSLSIILILITSLAFSQKKEERDVSGFSGISLGIQADLYFSQGSPAKVVIEANEDQLARIETVVSNGHLKIRCDSYKTRFKDVKIWITVPDIESLSLAGSGTMIAETPIDSEEFEMAVSGSGNIKISELRAEEVEAAISGSGDIYLGGTAGEMEVAISGSGSMNASDFQVEECEVGISGSGSCKVDATGELEAAISGSGRVIYFSDPVVDARVSGSGKVRKGDK